jgi:SAM-dependent methyltransferase
LLEVLQQPRRRYVFAIFTLAFATLSFQILLTRFFSVMLYYHFAFAAISLAMLGLTRGAMEVHGKPKRYTPERVDAEFARHAAYFALSSVGATILFLFLPLFAPENLITVALMATVFAFIAPFTEGGVCITLLLTRLPFSGGWLYAADLTGAALGCLAIIAALFFLDPVSATLWVGAFAAAAGWIAARDSRERGAVRLSLGVALSLGLAAVVHTGLAASGKSHIHVVWAKGTPQIGTLFERWNTYSRVRVKPLGEGAPNGWGYAHKPKVTVDQNYLDIDADASTVITHLDGDISKVSYLKDDVINSAYLTRRPYDVAIVGVGGGRDILSALYFGAQRITGIEINPAIFEALTDKFGDFSGHLDRYPGVSLVNAEARSYINHARGQYDLIQISLIDTWAATAAGGLTLTENRLYTVDAWRDFYAALKPGGMLSVSRWYDKNDHRGEFYRLIAIAADALQGLGVPANELNRHVIALNVGKIITVITSPTAFTDAEWAHARAAYEDEGFKVMLGPDVSFDTTTSTLLSDKADPAFFESLPEDISPSTDDNPFFFYTARPWDIFTGRTSVSMNNNAAVGMVRLLIFAAACAFAYYVVVPFFRLSRETPAKTLAVPVVYFSAIGLGFMLIEISQMQRLMVYLGHPVYGLGVVLFTVLLFSGLGSATVGAEPPRPGAMLTRLVALLSSLAIVGMLTPEATALTRSATTETRIIVSVLLLASPAFFMGMMFPLGLSVWKKQASLLPYFWSVNGIASTLASVLGMTLSIDFGIARTYAIGVCFYAVCACMIMATRRAKTIVASDGAEIRDLDALSLANRSATGG